MRKNALKKKLLNKTLLAFAIASGLAMPMSAHAANFSDTEDNRGATSATNTSAEATGWDGLSPALPDPDNTITAEAWGGTTINSDLDAAGNTSAHAIAYGLDNRASGLLQTGNSTIKVTATAGSASNDTLGGMNYSEVNVQAHGIHNREGQQLKTGNNNIEVTATGGTSGDPDYGELAYAKAYAYGLFNYDGEIETGNNAITVTATGGSASALTETFVFTRAYGLYNSDSFIPADNVSPVHEYSGGNVVIPPMSDYDNKLGEVTTGDNDITVNAKGGDGVSQSSRVYSYVQAYGLYNNGTLETKNNVINITAQGGVANNTGTAEARAEAYAYGIYNYGNLYDTFTRAMVEIGGTTKTEDNDITIVAKGGEAKSPVSNNTDAFVMTSGLYNAMFGAKLETGNNKINITAEGGTAQGLNGDDEAQVIASGIDNGDGTTTTKDNTITIRAEGGKARHDTSARAYGVRNGFIANIADGAAVTTDNNIIDIAAVGGTSSSGNALENASAHAYGIFNSIDNGIGAGENPQIKTGSNNIKVVAQGGTSTAIMSNADAHAYGIYAEYGTITATGEQIIYTEANAGIGTDAKAYAYALLATGGASIELDNTGAQPCEPTRTVQLTGDISAGGLGSSVGSITVALDNPDSFWRPRFQDELTVSPGSTYLQNGNFGSGTFTIKDGGTIDLAWAGNLGLKDGIEPVRRQLTLDGGAVNIGEGATFIVNSDIKNNVADSVKVSINPVLTITGAQYIRVAYDPAMTKDSDTITGKALVLDNSDDGGIDRADFKASGQDYTFDGPLNRIETYNVQIENENGDSYLTQFSYRTLATPAELGMTAADAQTAQINILRLQSNSLTRRMGELRNDSEEAKNGVWARTWGGKQTSDSSYLRNFDQKYYAMQLGYDWTRRKGNGKYITGITLEHMQGDADYLRGSGESKSTLAGAYMAWLGDKGHYFDIIGKIGRMNNNYNLTDLSNQYIESDYKNWAYTLSIEYGYRHKLNEKTFIEPQAELLLGRIQGADYTASNGVRINQKNTNMALARLGVLYGLNFGKDNKNNAYIRGSLLHDFSGDGSIDSSYGGGYRTIKTIGNIGTAFELNLGTNINMSKKSNLYFELTKTFGGNVKTDWQINAGLRINF